MRILHVNNQASVAFLISRSQRKLGHDSDLLAVRKMNQAEPDIEASGVGDIFLKLLKMAPRYDLIHVHGGIGISGLGLLPLKATGKRFFAHYHGSELRENIQTSFHSIAERIFISTPDLHRYKCNVGGRELIHIPNPVMMEGVQSIHLEDSSLIKGEEDTLRISHMPTRRAIKGTDNVIKAVEAAKESGAKLELDVIESLPREEAMRRLERSHICIDWMSERYDIHGVVSLEAMVRGIPVICNIDRSLYPSDISIIACKPSILADKLVEIADDPGMLIPISRSSFNYVNKYHEPMKVALKLEEYIDEAGGEDDKQHS
ncbi:MAG: hypothetical protein ACMUIE_08525 [Thermoplasmatota archaeon]